MCRVGLERTTRFNIWYVTRLIAYHIWYFLFITSSMNTYYIIFSSWEQAARASSYRPLQIPPRPTPFPHPPAV